MNLTDADTLKFLKGSPVFLDDICAVYSPTIGEIVEEGYDKFQEYISILTATKPTSPLLISLTLKVRAAVAVCENAP